MKLFCVLLLSAFAAVSNAASAASSFYTYESYKKDHGKKHASSVEGMARKVVFDKTHAMIMAHNAKGSTYQMAHNKFSDMHDHERAAYLGAVHPGDDASHRTMDVFRASADRALPASLDLRTNKCVGPVKDQGQCGSCWAFSATAALEYANCNKTGSYVALSEQDLVSCSQASSCNGGWPSSSWSFVQWRGFQSTQASYPYATVTYAGVSPDSCVSNWAVTGAKVKSFGYVANNVTAIQQALNTYGVLSVAFYVANDFYTYKSGVYSTTACAGINYANHAVNMVGYGTSSGTPYWIIRNSWGSGWGASGYVLIKSGVNMCNIESYVYYVQAA